MVDGVTLKGAWTLPKGQQHQHLVKAARRHINTPNSCPHSFEHNMAKTYKQMKEAWVSGHTGGSVADVNSVSLAMPVPYTYPQYTH